MKRTDLETLVVAVGFMVFVFIMFYIYDKYTKDDTLPVIEPKVESLTEKNDSLKITISNLDSIKNAKIIEINTLSDDSTIKLFYELLNE